MNTQNLVKMANQIATFFSAMPNREDAERDFLAHLERSWDPRMHEAMNTHLRTHNTDTGLNDFAERALRRQTIAS